MTAAPLARGARAAGLGLRLTLIDLYLARLLASRVALSFAIIFAVMMLERSLRLATQMAAVGAHMTFLPAMIWNLAPHYVALATPDALLIGMLLTIAQLDEDLEIVAMLASGFPLGRLVGALVGMAAVVAAASLIVLGVLEPLGLYRFRAVRIEAAESGWTAEAQPWAFLGTAGTVTLTADRTDATGRILEGVFVRQRHAGGGESVLTARAGRLGLAPDGRTATLALGPGRAFGLAVGDQPVVGAFGGLDMTDPAPVRSRPPVRGEQPQELTLAELAKAPPGPAGAALRSELYARIARVLSMPVLPFLALPLALATRGERRAIGMVMGGVLALAFREAFRLAQRLGEVGQVDPLTATAATFAAFLALVAWIFLSNRQLQGDTAVAVGLRRLRALAGRRAKRPAHVRPASRAGVGGYLRGVVGRSILATGAALVGLLVMIDLFERTGDILERGFGLAGLVRYAVLRSPVLAEQSIGIVTLLGAAIAFVRLARGSEIVAMRNLGLSLSDMARMCLPVGLAVAAVTVALAEVASPAAQLALARWWNTGVGAEAEPAERWFRVGGDLVAARAASRDGARLSDVVIYRRGAGDELDRRTAAASAATAAGAWRLTGVSELGIGREDTRARALPVARWNTPMRPQDVVSLFARPQQISSWTALRALSGEAPTDQSRGYLVTRLHRAFAEPLAPLIMLLLALPLALTPPRTGPSLRLGLWVLGAGIVYVVVDGISTAAGQTGMAAPWLAAWFAPLLFFGLAATAFLNAED